MCFFLMIRSSSSRNRSSCCSSMRAAAAAAAAPAAATVSSCSRSWTNTFWRDDYYDGNASATVAAACVVVTFGTIVYKLKPLIIAGHYKQQQLQQPYCSSSDRSSSISSEAPWVRRLFTTHDFAVARAMHEGTDLHRLRASVFGNPGGFSTPCVRETPPQASPRKFTKTCGIPLTPSPRTINQMQAASP